MSDDAEGVGAAIAPFVNRNGLIKVYDVVGSVYLGMLSGSLRAKLAADKVDAFVRSHAKGPGHACKDGLSFPVFRSAVRQVCSTHSSLKTEAL